MNTNAQQPSADPSSSTGPPVDTIKNPQISGQILQLSPTRRPLALLGLG